MLSKREKKLMLIAFEYGFNHNDMDKPNPSEIPDSEVFESWLDDHVDSQGGTVEMLLDFNNKNQLNVLHKG